MPEAVKNIVQYHHPDRLGTKLVTNNLDTTSFSQANLPFGTALDTESTGASNRRFTSYDRSVTTGLDYAVNRHYDPRQGRFTQPDPLGMAASSLADPQTLNMYSYVGNDPVNRIDPDGQFWGALFKFIAGLFTNLKPNVISGSFTYKNVPPISVAFTPNFQNIGVGFAGVGFDLRLGGHWLPDLLQPQESWVFNWGIHDFTDAERGRIRQAIEKIKGDRCRNWLENTIKNLGRPDLSVESTRPKTLDKLLEYAEFNKYVPKLTAKDMRISEDRRKRIADNYENAWTNMSIANAVTLGPDYIRIYLMPSAFWQDSNLFNWSGRDLSGIITFELLHVAGFGDDAIWKYRGALQQHCGDPSDNL